MLRYLVMCALSAFLAGPATAADLKARSMAPLVIPTEANTPKIQPVPTAAGNSGQALKAQASTVDNVGALRADNEQLKAKVKALNQQLTDMQYDKPHCSGLSTLSSKDGKQWDCAPSACDEEKAACFNGCNSTDECASGFTCDMRLHSCLIPRPCGDDPGAYWDESSHTCKYNESW